MAKQYATKARELNKLTTKLEKRFNLFRKDPMGKSIYKGFKESLIKDVGNVTDLDSNIELTRTAITDLGKLMDQQRNS